MLVPIRRIVSYKFFPACWTALIIVLLCLPGSLVPGKGIFSIPNLDKSVHIFLFGTNVLLWGWHYGQLTRFRKEIRQIILLDVVVTIVLGIALEYVQKYWIPNRSFDGKDILADLIGAVVAGTWLLWKAGRKNT
ncbi:MAG: VanZ family protein [Chitinophagaceae bacterium]|nr:VanZ family protein [Chitinophagaceae bacterium]